MRERLEINSGKLVQNELVRRELAMTSELLGREASQGSTLRLSKHIAASFTAIVVENGLLDRFADRGTRGATGGAAQQTTDDCCSDEIDLRSASIASCSGR